MRVEIDVVHCHFCAGTGRVSNGWTMVSCVRCRGTGQLPVYTPGPIPEKGANVNEDDSLTLRKRIAVALGWTQCPTDDRLWTMNKARVYWCDETVFLPEWGVDTFTGHGDTFRLRNRVLQIPRVEVTVSKSVFLADQDRYVCSVRYPIPEDPASMADCIAYAETSVAAEALALCQVLEALNPSAK